MTIINQRIAVQQYDDAVYDSTSIFKQADIRQQKGRKKGVHLFRHAFVSDLIAKNTPVNVVSELLGDVEKLILLCHASILKNKREKVKKALRGNYNTRYLFMLGENLRLWEEHQLSIKAIETQIGSLLNEMAEDHRDIVVDSPSCPSRHHNPEIKDLHAMLVQIFEGTNLSSISGINDYTMLRLLAKIGNDMSRFPTVKHFVSWLCLSPKSKQSGKMNVLSSESKGKACFIFAES